MQQGFNFDEEFKKVGGENTKPNVNSQPQQQMSFDNNGVIVEPNNVNQNTIYNQPQMPPQQPQYQPRPQVQQAPQQPQPQMPKQNGGNVQGEVYGVATVKQQIASAMQDKTISDSVLASLDKLITQNQLVFPKNYNVGNEIKLAYYQIMNTVGVETCNSMSIANALCETAIQGLSSSKKQCYYIKYGNSINMQRSYFGDIALAKRTGLVVDIFANVIRQGDEFEMAYDEIGREIVKVHNTKFENQDNDIIGAYACAIKPNGEKQYCIMTKKMIDANFGLSKARGKDGDIKFQRDFPGEASKRTAIRRLVKMIFNTDVNDDELAQQIINSYNRTEDEYVTNEDVKNKHVDVMNAEVREYSNVDNVSDDF